MALIEWREEYCTGIKGVDYEHEQLIRQINAVHALITDQADRSLVIDSLGEIYGSISAHFALEERIMREQSYFEYEEHKADHEELLDDIREIMENYEMGAYLDYEDTLAAHLNDWFTNHFKTKDARLHAYLD